jgi:hypothetical protein
MTFMLIMCRYLIQSKAGHGYADTGMCRRNQEFTERIWKIKVDQESLQEDTRALSEDGGTPA